MLIVLKNEVLDERSGGAAANHTSIQNLVRYSMRIGMDELARVPPQKLWVSTATK